MRKHLILKTQIKPNFMNETNMNHRKSLIEIALVTTSVFYLTFVTCETAGSSIKMFCRLLNLKTLIAQTS